MKILSKKFDGIDEAIFEASMDTISWTEALTSVSKLINVDGVTLEYDRGNGSPIESLVSFGFDQRTIDEYVEHYHTVNPRLAMRNGMDESSILFDHELSATAWGPGSGEFWDWLKNNRAPLYSASLVMPFANGTSLVLGMHRHNMAGGESEVNDFLVRFDAKMRLSRRLIDQSVLETALTQDQRNPTAQDHLIHVRFSDDLVLQDCPPKAILLLKSLDIFDYAAMPVLKLKDLGCNLAFHDAVKAAKTGKSATLSLTSPVADCSISLSVHHTGKRTHEFAMQIFYTTRAEAKPLLIANALSLTTRQSELVVFIMQGLSLIEASERMEISKNTGRVFMTQIFERTGVGKQIDLVRMVDDLARNW